MSNETVAKRWLATVMGYKKDGHLTFLVAGLTLKDYDPDLAARVKAIVVEQLAIDQGRLLDEMADLLEKSTQGWVLEAERLARLS